ncbi:hypothetical protein BU24DRAFT_170801 [Aaosphaeria arxii CBS 175.79]|uniref:Mediator of RNA polymerase II transcription subunit 11 n=1 Tax=Aaosphaeria arxii CBS 175.79 TaxID=1450172 RepID=A0A6A5Y038_9PLEO|nr:uncharacterized protein BU24DRAFT_170801 [Aaosphaeria arxii CBS 175.79]KAF2018427.1 hypothetical protein BU24DRAFT_170801 [Aaosphaeria arxii CBS 175.79]
MSSQPYTETAAKQIRELSAINEQLPELLRKTASTLSLLTQHPVQTPGTSLSTLSTQQGRKDLLQTSTHELFIQINTIRTTLKTQVTDLEKEKVVPSEAPRFIAAVRIEGQSDEDRERERLKDSESHVTNGGLGSLDVGVLNANVRSGRGARGDEELLERIEKIVSNLKQGAGFETHRDHDEEMVDG